MIEKSQGQYQYEMSGLLRKNRKRINEELNTCHKRKFFTPLTYGAHSVTAPAIRNYTGGKLIDIGCGDMPYKELIMNKVSHYDTFDVEERTEGVTFIGDVQNMDIIDDNSYDSAVCFEVLEHVPEPAKALSEIFRILKPKAHLILTVPHLSRLHEEPHDYFRFTKYGIQQLIEVAGFKVIEINAHGSILSFLGHQSSTFFVCLFWHIPVIKHIVFFINKWLCVRLCHFIDETLDKNHIFACGYSCVAQKPDKKREEKTK
jgi:SAM-dependent methyltransferase